MLRNVPSSSFPSSSSVIVVRRGFVCRVGCFVGGSPTTSSSSNHGRRRARGWLREGLSALHAERRRGGGEPLSEAPQVERGAAAQRGHVWLLVEAHQAPPARASALASRTARALADSPAARAWLAVKRSSSAQHRNTTSAMRSASGAATRLLRETFTAAE
eukprot:CAMPEP_0171896194 /NCGR_PEP_ID=MMETSP0992-20121227/47444_1 /TAXON_ID=483369 /ORGANISM="non described non described, Strain CCMP2098" /LENGTH=159 /DNA_ID=CAMNT_0012524183 /DNA_START=394 /DNA_END=875 /DNA_ORIENTATION=-